MCARDGWRPSESFDAFDEPVMLPSRRRSDENASDGRRAIARSDSGDVVRRSGEGISSLCCVMGPEGSDGIGSASHG